MGSLRPPPSPPPLGGNLRRTWAGAELPVMLELAAFTLMVYRPTLVPCSSRLALLAVAWSPAGSLGASDT